MAQSKEGGRGRGGGFNVLSLDFVVFLGWMFIFQVLIPLYIFVFDPRPQRLVYDIAMRMLKTNFHIAGRNKIAAPEKQKRIIYLCNHRSWGDFCTDRAITLYHGIYLSRWLVAIAIPFQCALAGFGTGYGTHTCMFFNRGGSGGRKAFFKQLDRLTKGAHFGGMIIYPEGHRSQSLTSLTLKDGCMQYAYERDQDVQVVITRNKEDVIDERHGRCHIGTNLVTAYSPRISKAKGESFEDYKARITEQWEKQWKLAYETKVEDCEPWDPINDKNAPEFPAPSPQFQAVRAVLSPIILFSIWKAFSSLGRLVF